MRVAGRSCSAGAPARAEIEPRSEEGLGALGEREDGEEAEGADEHEQYEQVDPPGQG